MAISLPLGSGNTGTNDWSDVYNNDAQLVTEIDARDDNYQTVQVASATASASQSGPFVSSILFYFGAADYTIASKTQKLRLRVVQPTNAVGPGTTLTAGLYPVTGTVANVWTLGTVTSGSTVAFASTAANTLAQGNSGDFTIPSDGYFTLAVASSGTTAGGSGHSLFMTLQTRWV